MDLGRFQSDLNALAPGNVQLLNITGIAKNFREWLHRELDGRSRS